MKHAVAIMLGLCVCAVATADVLPVDYGTAGTAQYGGVVTPGADRGPVETTIEFRDGTVGGNGSRGVVVASFPLSDLPGPGSWIVDVDLTGQEFTISMADFGYSYHYYAGDDPNGVPIYEGVQGGGPLICTGGLGNEDQFYGDGPPDWPGWYWFGGDPWAGFYMKMWDASGNVVYDNTAQTGYYYGGSALDWGDMADVPVTIGAFQIGYSTEVPEPAAFSLLVLGAVALLRRR
jgi:MYXO-CTERM domain-containing protein